MSANLNSVLNELDSNVWTLNQLIAMAAGMAGGLSVGEPPTARERDDLVAMLEACSAIGERQVTTIRAAWGVLHNKPEVA